MENNEFVRLDDVQILKKEVSPELQEILDEVGNVTEDDIARENGFWVDEDGNWQPLDDDDLDW